MCGNAFIRVCFFLRSGFAFTDLQSFPLRLCPSLLFTSQKHPGSSHLLQNHLQRVLLLSFKVLSSLTSFICLSGPLFANIHQDTSLTLDFSQVSSSSSSLFPVVVFSVFSLFNSDESSNNVGCWLHPGFNPDLLGLICFNQKLKLRAKSAK